MSDSKPTVGLVVPITGREVAKPDRRQLTRRVSDDLAERLKGRFGNNGGGRLKRSEQAQKSWAEMKRWAGAELLLALEDIDGLPEADPGPRRRADVLGSARGHIGLADRWLGGESDDE